MILMPRPDFIRVEDESVYFDKDGCFIFFVPESYYDKRCAIEEGEYTELIGILNYTLKKDENDKDFSKNIRTFEWCSRFVTKPGRTEKVKGLQLTPKSTPTDYRLLYYTNNGSDQIIVSDSVPQDIQNVEDIFRLFLLTGNIPNTISYDHIHEIYMESMLANGKSYGVSAQILGLIPAEHCRCPRDLSIPYRLSGSNDLYDYRALAVNKIPKYNGPYISITSENWDDSLIGAIEHPDAKDSPLERVIMGL